MFNVVVGEGIQFSFGEGGKFSPFHPVEAQVLAVSADTITVADWHSANGLAAIVIHNTSFETGRFWYKCKTEDRSALDRSITKLANKDGVKIHFKQFIES